MAEAQTEPVRFAVVGPVVIVRFMEPPSGATAEAILKVTRAAETSGQGKLSFVGVVGGGLTMPSSDFRARLAAEGNTIRAAAASLHFVIEGEGLMTRLQRAMVGAISGVVAIGIPFHIHSDLEEGLRKVEELRHISFATLVAETRRAGILLDPQG